MKKNTRLLFAIILIMALASCSSDDKSSAPQPAGGDSSTADSKAVPLGSSSLPVCTHGWMGNFEHQKTNQPSKGLVKTGEPLEAAENTHLKWSHWKFFSKLDNPKFMPFKKNSEEHKTHQAEQDAISAYQSRKVVISYLVAPNNFEIEVREEDKNWADQPKVVSVHGFNKDELLFKPDSFGPIQINFDRRFVSMTDQREESEFWPIIPNQNILHPKRKEMVFDLKSDTPISFAYDLEAPGKENYVGSGAFAPNSHNHVFHIEKLVNGVALREDFISSLDEKKALMKIKSSLKFHQIRQLQWISDEDLLITSYAPLGGECGPVSGKKMPVISKVLNIKRKEFSCELRTTGELIPLAARNSFALPRVEDMEIDIYNNQCEIVQTLKIPSTEQEVDTSRGYYNSVKDWKRPEEHLPYGWHRGIRIESSPNQRFLLFEFDRKEISVLDLNSGEGFEVAKDSPANWYWSTHHGVKWVGKQRLQINYTMSERDLERVDVPNPKNAHNYLWEEFWDPRNDVENDSIVFELQGIHWNRFSY